MPFSHWIRAEDIDPPAGFLAIDREDNNSNNNDPGDLPHLILTDFVSNSVPVIKLSYKIESVHDDEQPLQGFYLIQSIRFGEELVDVDGHEEERTTIDFKRVDNPGIVNNLTFIRRLVEDDDSTNCFASETINGVTRRIEIDDYFFDFASTALIESVDSFGWDLHANWVPPAPPAPIVPAPAPIVPAPAPIVPAPAPTVSTFQPLPGTPPALGLMPGKHYHVWTRMSTGFKHEGHGKFVRFQNDYKDALFEPFTLESGVVLESQVFTVQSSYFYKMENIKGGKRKTRKSRKSKKSRKVRKSRRSMRR